MSFVNYYKLLQIQPTADSEVIEVAVKACLKKSPENAVQITKAKLTLTDSGKRDAYNAEIRAQANNTIGNYKIVRRIAEGGFGRVYEGIHQTLDEKVCIKHNINISAFDTEILIKEAKSIWNLRHYALPAVRDFIILEDGSCALVMTYIEGPTLAQLVEKNEINTESVCWMISRVLDALRYLHFSGVVHGDIKPQNIIVQPEQHTCVLVDFGLSAIKPSKDSHSEGYTPMFASPEALADKPLLPESDLYSLGLTMIYVLGGNPEKKQIPDTIPKPVRDFINDLLIHDVKHRPHWGKFDLLEKFQQVRFQAFGREHTLKK